MAGSRRWQAILVVVAGVGVITGIGLWIARDARRRAPLTVGDSESAHLAGGRAQARAGDQAQAAGQGQGRARAAPAQPLRPAVGRGDLPALAGLDIADPPDVWRRLGFTVAADGTCVARATLTLRLLGTQARGGHRRLDAASRRRAAAAGRRRDRRPRRGRRRPPPRRRRIPTAPLGVDHVVVRTPDLQRTLTALERHRHGGAPRARGAPGPAPGVPLGGRRAARGRRAAGAGGRRARRACGASSSSRPTSTLLAALPGEPLGSVREAVQPGRRIATVRRELGSSVPLAFMTPAPARGHRGGEHMTIRRTLGLILAVTAALCGVLAAPGRGVAADRVRRDDAEHPGARPVAAARARRCSPTGTAR